CISFRGGPRIEFIGISYRGGTRKTVDDCDELSSCGLWAPRFVTCKCFSRLRNQAGFDICCQTGRCEIAMPWRAKSTIPLWAAGRGRVMLVARNHNLDMVEAELRGARAVTPELMFDVTTRACVRLAAHSRTAQAKVRRTSVCVCAYAPGP